MNLNVRNYPILLLEDLESFILSLREITRANAGIISIKKDTNDIFFVKDAFPESNFFYRIYTPKLSGKESLYSFQKAPHSISSLDTYNGTANKDSILNDYKSWIKTIDTYNQFKLEEEDVFENQYENEFYSAFEIIDEDANSSSFNFDQQILLDNYIQKAIIYIQNTDEFDESEKKELIDEAKQIEVSIRLEPKNSVVKRNSKFWARIRKKSIQACKFVMSEFFKEVIKEGVKQGFNFAKDHLPGYIDSIKVII